MNKHTIVICSLIAFMALGCSAPKDEKGGTPPNVLLILVDDMGYHSISCFGDKPWKTPNIDRLAESGMKLTNAYASPVCSPTRASILTGKDPARVGVSNWIPGWAEKYSNPKLIEKPFKHRLDLSEYTLAEALKENGYRTALVGKWHLGHTSLHHLPDKQGFDYHYMIAFSNLGTWFADYDEKQLLGFTGKEKPGSQFLTDHLADRAIEWMEDNREDPFFLFFSTHVVHKPIAAEAEVLQKYLDAGLPETGPDAADYAAMHEHMDLAIGRVLAKLNELGLDDNTIVIFLSDNGGRMPQTVNTPFRGGKGELLEGGIRTPLIVKWPGHVEDGSSSEVLAITHDLYPTILDLTGNELLPEHHVDGISLAGIMTGSGDDPGRNTLGWHYPHYNGKPYGKPSSAIREGKWKLIDVLEFDGPELYDLESDPGETVNLAEEHPEVLARLLGKLEAYRGDIQAKMPEPNPDYDPDGISGWPTDLNK